MSTRIELLRPAQIRTAMAERSLIYLPLGTIEWHCEHLPVGLDALTAHGLCLRAAAMTGGLVWPPLYYGTGGDHGAYPWTVMLDDPAPLEALLEKTLQRLAQLDVRRVVLFSGHFADEQLAMIDRMADAWQDTASGLEVIALSVNRFESDIGPDHAGRFETTLLAGLKPETVDLGSLPASRAGDEALDRHDPDHPLWGVIGTDPRTADLSEGPELVRAIAAQLAMRATAPGNTA